MSDGWNESAEGWLAEIGTEGDWSRRHVLDRPMMERVTRQPFSSALDIGCGEGRFCRMMQAHGIRTTGIDPTVALIDQARSLDPAGDYQVGRAEALGIPDRSFDLAVSYLTLIDIPDLSGAIAEIYRVLRPGGTFLIANLQSFHTAGGPNGWTKSANGQARFCIDHYMDTRAEWVTWGGVRIQNWHRPLGVYMQALLQASFELRHFAEPEPTDDDTKRVARYRRVPFFLLMEWEKV